MMVCHYQSEIAEDMQQANRFDERVQKLTDKVMRRGELIVELKNCNTSRVVRANVTKLNRLQTADL
ncbi:hypothetical protein Tco_1545380, partial [Tanacetum coccineum]